MTETRSLHVVLCRYGSGAPAARGSAMGEHLSYLRANAHRLRFAGPLLADDGRTPTGSNAIVEVADRAGAERFIAEEAFHRAGMFDSVEIFRFASAVGGRQVHLTADPDRQMYLCLWTTPATDAGSGAVRPPEVGPAVRLLEGGVLLGDDGSGVIGGLLILEARDQRAAEEAVALDLGPRAADVDRLLVSRWRFGRALGGG